MSKLKQKTLLPFWLRIPLGLACWALASWGFFLYLAKKQDIPDGLFSVCVLDDARPILARLASPEQWQDKPLCRDSLYFEDHEGIRRIYVERNDDTIYVREFADSPSDPLEFSYRIDDSTQPPTITPLWWRRNAMLSKMIAVLFAIPFADMLYRILRKIIIHRFYREGKNASTKSSDKNG